MDEENKTQAAEPKERKMVSFRASKVVQKQLSELAERWGENFTRVIYRALALAYEKELGKKRS